MPIFPSGKEEPDGHIPQEFLSIFSYHALLDENRKVQVSDFAHIVIRFPRMIISLIHDDASGEVHRSFDCSQDVEFNNLFKFVLQESRAAGSTSLFDASDKALNLKDPIHCFVVSQSIRHRGPSRSVDRRQSAISSMRISRPGNSVGRKTSLGP